MVWIRTDILGPKSLQRLIADEENHTSSQRIAFYTRCIYLNAAKGSIAHKQKSKRMMIDVFKPRPECHSKSLDSTKLTNATMNEHVT